MPRDPEKDGWHWLYNKRLGKECDFKECVFWTGAGEFWQMMGAEECFSPRDFIVREWCYHGPCLTPDQATALQARVAELEGALRQIEYLDRPQIRGLPRRVSIQEIALAALEGEKELPTMTEEQLRKMMRDPRYWRQRNPEWVKRVTDGFRALVGGKKDE